LLGWKDFGFSPVGESSWLTSTTHYISYMYVSNKIRVQNTLASFDSEPSWAVSSLSCIWECNILLETEIVHRFQCEKWGGHSPKRKREWKWESGSGRSESGSGSGILGMFTDIGLSSK